MNYTQSIHIWLLQAEKVYKPHARAVPAIFFPISYIQTTWCKRTATNFIFICHYNVQMFYETHMYVLLT